jgi:hypothetical protein
MIRLPHALSAWSTLAFNAVLKNEIEHLNADLLPLHQGLSQASHVLAGKLSAMPIAVLEETNCLRVTVGIFYSGLMAGCSCSDDPTPADEINEYCELRFDIDRQTAEATVTLLSD